MIFALQFWLYFNIITICQFVEKQYNRKVVKTLFQGIHIYSLFNYFSFVITNKWYSNIKIKIIMIRKRNKAENFIYNFAFFLYFINFLSTTEIHIHSYIEH